MSDTNNNEGEISDCEAKYNEGEMSDCESNDNEGNTSDCETNNNEGKIIDPETNDNECPVEKKKSSNKIIRILSLIILAFSEFLGGCTLSILAPFYSKEAEDHGLSVADSGSVFASVFVLQIVFVPIFGKLITRIGSTRLFITGVLLAGITNFAFGFLPRIQSGTWFLAASLMMRAVTAVGEAAMNTAILPLARRRAGKGRESSVLSLMETMNGVGTTFGPFVGGVLFNYGGFAFPFAVSGSLMIVCGLAGIFVLDPTEEEGRKGKRQDGEQQERGYRQPTISTLILSSSVFLAFTITVTTGAAQQWYQPSLEPYVRNQFGLNPFETSMLFIIDGAVYALVSPVIGILLDHCMDPRTSILGGTSVICVSYLLLGPLPPFVMEPSITQVCVGAGLHGLGLSANFMGTLTLLSEMPGGKGESEERIVGLLTSIWITGENLGNFLGAAAGGAVYDRMGWKISCLVVASIQLLGMLLIVSVWLYQNYRKARRGRNKCPKDETKKPLLAGKEEAAGYGACAHNCENNNCIDVESSRTI